MSETKTVGILKTWCQEYSVFILRQSDMGLVAKLTYIEDISV